MKALVIRTDDLAEIVEFPAKEQDKLKWYYETLGCDFIDIVRPYGIEKVAEKYGLESLTNKFCIICDDEALLKDQPKVNPIASLLYGYDDHGQPLFGDVLIAMNQETDDGIDSVGYGNADMMLLQAAIQGLIEMHNEKVVERKDE